MEIGLVKPPDEIMGTPLSMMDSTPLLLLTLSTLFVVMGIGLLLNHKQKAISILPIMFICIISSVVLPSNAYSYGSPLDTSSIGLFAYYKVNAGITLANTVTGWQSYTDNGFYYDGIVRVKTNTVGTTFTSASTYYIDINVRVRNDGWILAWLTTAQSENYIPFFQNGIDYGDTTNAIDFLDYQTTLGRAIYRLLYVASIVGTYTYSSVGYYDYEKPLATKLIMIQAFYNVYGGGDYIRNMYFSIPSGTVYKAWAISYSWMYIYGYTSNLYLSFDDVVIASTIGNRYLYGGADITASCTLMTSHNLQTRDSYNSGNKSVSMQSVLLLWM